MSSDIKQTNPQEQLFSEKGLFTFYREEEQLQRYLVDLQQVSKCKKNKSKTKLRKKKNKSNNKVNKNLRTVKQEKKITDNTLEQGQRDMKHEFLRKIIESKSHNSMLINKSLLKKSQVLYTEQPERQKSFINNQSKKISNSLTLVKESSQQQSLIDNKINSKTFLKLKQSPFNTKSQLYCRDSNNEKSSDDFSKNKVMKNFYHYQSSEKKLREKMRSEPMRLKTQQVGSIGTSMKNLREKQLVRLPVISNVRLSKALAHLDNLSSKNTQMPKNRYQSINSKKLFSKNLSSESKNLSIFHQQRKSILNFAKVDLSGQQIMQTGHQWTFRKKDILRKLGIERNL